MLRCPICGTTTLTEKDPEEDSEGSVVLLVSACYDNEDTETYDAPCWRKEHPDGARLGHFVCANGHVFYTDPTQGGQ